ncbi:Sterol esterase TGL1 [Nakaseomyces bracarensis]|uniref:Sterol esterase TGL1 n=1 Tax=Nakaseomyces bracarensis TaxID=273131 RepID=A0ABR4NMH4_9SACH
MIFNRFTITDYVIVVLVYVETVFAFFLKLIPQPLISLLEWLINYSFSADNTSFEERLRTAETIHDICGMFGIEVEDHLVRTEDDYILTLHRIPPRPGTANGKTVYLHHGLLMCSDVWVCNMERHRNLPFVLHDLGFDVWMGNNRGNKYSTAHLYKQPRSKAFWDFSIDEFAFFDIPNSIQFVLDRCKVDQLICIGFSQGSAQMFAALSISEELNKKVSHFIAIAPAMTPRGLHNRIVDTLAKSSPMLMYLFFGRNIILPSAVVWQRTIHPKLFNFFIDFGNKILFNWKALNITPKQKMASYSKLYSTTSVKSIVHWFQILRAQKFQMFEEQDDMFNSLTRPYKIPRFPTKTNIKTPILLIYGGVDSLVDINVMRSNLPMTNVFDVKVDLHEHLDLLWGKDTDTLVIAKVLRFIEFFSNGELLQPAITMAEPGRIMQVSAASQEKSPYDESPSRRNSVNSSNVTATPINQNKNNSSRIYEPSVSPTAQYGLEKINSIYSAIGRSLEDISEAEPFLEEARKEKEVEEIHNTMKQRRLSEYLESSTELKHIDSNTTTNVNTPN